MYRNSPDKYQDSNGNEYPNRSPKPKPDQYIDPKYELSGSLISSTPDNGLYSRQRNQEVLRNNLQQQLRGQTNHARSIVPLIPPPQKQYQQQQQQQNQQQQYTHYRNYDERGVRSQAYQELQMHRNQNHSQRQPLPQVPNQHQQKYKINSRSHNLSSNLQYPQQQYPQTLHHVPSRSHHPYQQHQQQHQQHLQHQQPIQQQTHSSQQIHNLSQKNQGHAPYQHSIHSFSRLQDSFKYQNSDKVGHNKHYSETNHGSNLIKAKGLSKLKVLSPLVLSFEKEKSQTIQKDVNKVSSSPTNQSLSNPMGVQDPVKIIVQDSSDSESKLEASDPTHNTSGRDSPLENGKVSQPVKTQDINNASNFKISADSSNLLSPSKHQSFRTRSSSRSSKSTTASYNSDTSSSNITPTSSGKRKSNPYYETAVHNIEQEKKMLAALKRLSIGQLNYDPELPMDDIEMQLKQEYDEPSPNILNNFKYELEEQAKLTYLDADLNENASQTVSDKQKYSDAEQLADLPTSKEANDESFENDRTIFAPTNSLLWVPANLHPEVDPVLFKAHVKNKVDEISEKLSGSKSSAQSADSPAVSENDDFNPQIRRGPSQNGLYRSNSRNSNGQQSKRESIHSQSFSNPSLRDLTSELEKLSKAAGLDATDAVTLARSLSTSSLGYTDIEKLAFDDLSTSGTETSRRTSLISIDDIESGSDEDDFSYTSSNSAGDKRSSSPPISTTLQLQQELRKQFQQSQLLKEKEHAERELLEEEKQEKLEHNIREQKATRDYRLKDAHQPELEQFDQRYKEQTMNNESLFMREDLKRQQKNEQQQQKTRDFALKRSRRPDYRKQAQASHGFDLQESKHEKLVDLKNKSQYSLEEDIKGSLTKSKSRSARDSQLLFNYKKPNEMDRKIKPDLSDSAFSNVSEKQNDLRSYTLHSNIDQDKLDRNLVAERHSADPSKLSISTKNQSDAVDISLQVGGRNLRISESKEPESQRPKENLDLLRSEINQFKETLTQSDTDQVLKNLQVPVSSNNRELSPNGSDSNQSDFSFELSYQDVSYEDPLGMDQEVLRELIKEQGDKSNVEQFEAEDRIGRLKKQVNEHKEQLEILNQQKLKLNQQLSPQVQDPKNNSIANISVQETKHGLQTHHDRQQVQPQVSKVENEFFVEERKVKPQEAIHEGDRSSASSSHPFLNLEDNKINVRTTKETSLEMGSASRYTMRNTAPRRLEELVFESDHEESLVDFDTETEINVIDIDAIGPEDLIETSTPKKLKKKSSLTKLKEGLLSTETGESNQSKRLKKKKSWGWLRDRSSSLSSVDSSNLPPIPDNVKVATRSISNPESLTTDLTIKSEKSKIFGGKSKTSIEPTNNGPLNKENMIAKLFKKKKPNQSSDTTANTIAVSGSTIVEHVNEKKKRSSSGSFFRKKDKSKVVNDSAVKAEQDGLIIRNSSSSSSLEIQRSVDSGTNNSYRQDHLMDSQINQLQNGAYNDKENQVPNDDTSYAYKSKATFEQGQLPVGSESDKDGRLISLKRKSKSEKFKVQDQVEKIEKTGIDSKSIPDLEEKPIQTTLDVQEKLKKSIRRTSKANQPIEFTDSAFGFPLPPPSQSTLVMLDYRFPVHVERAIYRLSHLKLANPKRSLREQVLLSNFMYAYLNLVDHTLHLEQQLTDGEGVQEEQLFDQSLNDEESVDESIDLDVNDCDLRNTTTIEV